MADRPRILNDSSMRITWAIRLLHVWLVGLLCTLTGQSDLSAQSVNGLRETSEQASNPHWSAAGCVHCHGGDGGKVKPIPPAGIDSLCVSCHNGRRAKAERHPISRMFESPQVRLPDGWPAHDRVLGCATCHDIRSACDQALPRPTVNPMFLRGYDGGRLQDFCANCHVADAQHGLYNPHLMLTLDHTPIEQSCFYCHTHSFDLSRRTERSGRPMLRTGEPGLCLACHREHVDYFEPGHLGAKPSATMQATLAEFEKVRLGVAGGLPLTTEGAIVCTTCHNPHQAGLFPADSVLSFGSMPLDAERSGSGLRWRGAELCVACHYFRAPPAAGR